MSAIKEAVAAAIRGYVGEQGYITADPSIDYVCVDAFFSINELLDAALAALIATGPSDEMVEAGARVLLENDAYARQAVEGAAYLANHVANHPEDEVAAFNLRSAQRKANKEWGGCKDIARACLVAALAKVGA